MIDKEEPLFIMMMEHHSRKQSIRNNIWAYCSSQWSSVSQNSVPFLSRGLIVYDFLQEKWANFMNYCVTYVFPLLTSLFRPSEFVFSSACLSVLELSDWQDATLTYWVILPPPTQHPVLWVSSGTASPSNESNMLLETKRDRQIGREAVGDGDDNDVCLHGGLTPLTTCQQHRPRYHRRETGRTLLSNGFLREPVK